MSQEEKESNLFCFMRKIPTQGNAYILLLSPFIYLRISFHFSSLLTRLNVFFSVAPLRAILLMLIWALYFMQIM